MVSERTKEVKRKRNTFFILSLCLLLAAILFTFINVVIKLNVPKDASTGEPLVQISQGLVDKIVSFGVTFVIVLILALFIKDKARTAIYMLCLIISILTRGEFGAYFILAFWAFDEYVFYPLYKRFKNKVEINKEIDLRG